ncbi:MULTISPECIES: hypothetical protein [Geomicrobium]|uniref:TM2 domain-containing membrane protein YozV n=1 Tax=Geomicrobium sediminis TaxID=1347788 RepID=A0ABS2PFL2_9BACL|nr:MULTISPECIES: hypothetical protein [Geomicrobium]MBM7634136.1 TM2 domain-containing membrane protein YozV [Geomicrobium sediminis]GAJ98308.1 hypothetical protein JCM19055_1227 [Geomicrobium sp. JCM 19055]GAK07660.1 hypothetical protein JCM19038_1402 [Geomicrobium sp. JCM 19038]
MDPQLRNGMIFVFIGLVLLFLTFIVHFSLWLWAMIVGASFVINGVGVVHLIRYIRKL